MDKTPVTRLQELGARERVVPKYTIILQSSDVNKFTCQVEYTNHCVTGSASSKKQAKHNAAQNMLQLLEQSKNIHCNYVDQLLSNKNNIDIKKSSLCMSTTMDSVFTNYVGSLQEYCSKYNLVNPSFELSQVNGPSHNMEFIMSCTVGSITEEAAGSTKKQAKQNVAQKVLENLSKTLNIRSSETCKQLNKSPQQVNEQILEDLNLKIHNLRTIDSSYSKNIEFKFKNAVKSKALTSLIHLNEKISIDDYHFFYKKLIYDKVGNSKPEKSVLFIAALKTYLENSNDVDKCTIILAHIKKQFNISLERVTLISNEKGMKIIGFRVNHCVPFTQFNSSNNEISAERGALMKVLEALMLYLE